VVSYLTVASEQPGDVGARAKSALKELETLDPETVKTARSLMAFGALGRARGMATAAANAVGAKTQVTDVAVVAAKSGTDAKQGFAASAADDKTDSKSIPDPASFEEKDSQVKPAKSSATAETLATTATDGAPTAKAASPVVTTITVAPRAVAAPALIGKVSPVVVVGVPLLAAAFLMGVYWMILRAGAV
jgi:hypothetical protein